MDENDLDQGELINDRYEIQDFIGKGSFGNVYRAIDLKTKRLLAIKTENIDDTKNEYLYEEFKLYNKIMNHKSIPNVYHYGEHRNKNILVMSYLGYNLGTLFKFCEKKFSMKTVCMIMIQTIDILEHIHSFGIIHKDIKPENMLIGHNSERNTIYLVDFGLSDRYLINKITHIPWNDKRQFCGTYRYSSIRNHEGSEQSRRDDLESLGYVMIYFLKGKLPWENLKPKEGEPRVIQIFNKKKNITCEKLTRNMDPMIYNYMKYIRMLRFRDKPNYFKIKQCFIEYMQTNNFKYDNMFDWVIKTREINTQQQRAPDK